MRNVFQTGLRWCWVSLLVIIIDRLTKMVVLSHLVVYKPLQMTSFFNLTLAYNKGAAFSFLGSASGWQSWLFGLLAVAVSVTLLIWLKRLSSQQWWISIALSLIIGGALGNLFDRVYYGEVIDFLQFHAGQFYWPVFNIADSAICAGAFMLVVEAIFNKNKK
jgi:signal peptidase II